MLYSGYNAKIRYSFTKYTTKKKKENKIAKELFISNKVIYRLKTAIEKIDQITEICKPKGITETLKDEALTKPAIMKHIDVIYRQFEKLE